ncbi:MAG: divalent metal cation transporter, partial [Adlercreutzia sp.]
MNAKDMRTTAAGRLGAEESARHQAAEEIADTGIPAGEQIGPAATKKPSKLLLVLAAMGPGVVTAMAGNDAGGISTYSTAGANFGFGTLWV